MKNFAENFRSQTLNVLEVGCYNLHIIVLFLITKLYDDYEEKLKTISDCEGKFQQNWSRNNLYIQYFFYSSFI